MKSIEKSNYQGYLWYSDQQKPVVYSGEEQNGFTFDETKNPFVVEGYLSDGKTSYSIKFAGGRYIIKSYDLQALQVQTDNGLVCEEKCYYTHRMSFQKMRFRQYWRPESDPMCADMKTLKPAEFVFVEFEKE